MLSHLVVIAAITLLAFSRAVRKTASRQTLEGVFYFRSGRESTVRWRRTPANAPDFCVNPPRRTRTGVSDHPGLPIEAISVSFF